MTRSVLIPITNVYAKGDYTAEVHIGSQKQTANLILDSGSSTLVVQNEDYDPHLDTSLSPTEFSQNVTYGMGGWYGPVVKTQVHLGKGLFKAGLTDVHIAVTKKEVTGCFGKADGLFGLAYRELNRAYNLSQYLSENDINPAVTFPWHLEEEEADDTVREFKQFLRKYPSQEIKPYFTQLEEQGVVGNQFGFLIHRSSIYQTESEKSLEQLKEHPLNNGLFIMGHPRHHEHLYKGELKHVKVLDDKYYNVHLISLRVGDLPSIEIPILKQKNKRYITNATIDSGASMIILPEVLFDQLIENLIQINQNFCPILEPFRTFEGKEKGIAMESVNLEEWPDIYFDFEGFDDEIVTLCMTPETYWQTHAPSPNEISFQFLTLPNWRNQTIFGLPFMNNYFTIFDRAAGDTGAVVFAEKEFAPHRLKEEEQSNVGELKKQFNEHQLGFDDF